MSTSTESASADDRNKRPRLGNASDSTTSHELSVTSPPNMNQRPLYHSSRRSPSNNTTSAIRHSSTSPHQPRNINRPLPSVTFQNTSNSQNTRHTTIPVEPTQQKKGGKMKNQKNKENTAEKIKNFLNGLAETLPQPLGLLCKEIATKTLSLTRNIEQRKSTTQKMNCDNPNSTPRAININVMLRAPDIHRETDVFKAMSTELDTLINEFKANATELMKRNAEEIIKTLKKERLTYLTEKSLILIQCFYTYYRMKNPNTPENQTALDGEKLAKIATRNFYSRQLEQEVLDYLDLPEDEIKAYIEGTFQRIPFEFDSNNENEFNVATLLCEEMRKYFQKYILGLLNIIDEDKNNIMLETELTTIIKQNNIQKSN